MAEHHFSPEHPRVYFTAAAIGLGTAALSGVVWTLVRRHKEEGASVILEGIDDETAASLGAMRVEPSDEPLAEVDVAYIGCVEDNARLTDGIEEVHVIADERAFNVMRKWVRAGAAFVRSGPAGE